MSRNMNYLNKNRIIYRRDPITDIPSEIFKWGRFYKEGTHECYELFRSKAKINTFKSLRWHMIVLLYLNQELSKRAFTNLCKHIALKKNNFVTFEISSDILHNIIDDIYKIDLERAPKNKLRKIIFNDMTGLTRSEKLSIVGKLIGRKKIATKENIYECMNAIHNIHMCITVQTIAEALGCSTRTVYRSLDNEIKTKKDLLNSMI
jgi:hypothetical protein